MNQEGEAFVPILTHETTIHVKGAKDAPANVLNCPTNKRIELVFPEGAKIAKIGSSRKLAPGETVDGAIAWCYRALPGATSSELGPGRRSSSLPQARRARRRIASLVVVPVLHAVRPGQWPTSHNRRPGSADVGSH